MSTVTLSPDFQIQIPDKIRQALRLAPGDEFKVVILPGRVELVPVRDAPEDPKPMSAYRGILKGMDTTIEDDDED